MESTWAWSGLGVQNARLEFQGHMPEELNWSMFPQFLMVFALFGVVGNAEPEALAAIVGN